MKVIKIGTLLSIFLFFVAGLGNALDIDSVESHELVDRLLSLSGPGAPEIFEDMVIFTASSSFRRVGVAFASEGFSQVHWLRPLWVRKDITVDSTTDLNPELHGDSGILFYVHQIPEGATSVEYRLVVNGLWATDPANPVTRWDRASGLSLSVLAVPPRNVPPNPLVGPPGGLSFSFQGPPGETVTVGGSFNGWDPFMYELREGPAGTYSLHLPLPPGRYQYVFFHRGERFADPYNPNRVYSREGNVASEIVIP